MRGEEDTAADTGDNTTKLLQNIFPFAFPVALHTRTLAALKADGMSHIFILTRSAHPGLAVAARESGLEVVLLLQGFMCEAASCPLWSPQK